MALNTVTVNGSGTKLKMGDGSSPETFTLIPSVMKFGRIGNKGTFQEATPIDSTDREYFAGLSETAEFDITMLSIAGDATQQALRAHANAQDTVNFEVEMTTGETASLTLVLNKADYDPPEHDKPATLIVYAKVTGGVEFSTT